MKNIIKHSINLRIIKATYNVVNVPKNTISNLFNVLKLIVKNVIYNDHILRLIFFMSKIKDTIIKTRDNMYKII